MGENGDARIQGRPHMLERGPQIAEKEALSPVEAPKPIVEPDEPQVATEPNRLLKKAS